METNEIKTVYIVDYCQGLCWNVYHDIEDAKKEAHDWIIAEARKRHKLDWVFKDIDDLGWYFYIRDDMRWVRVRALTLK